MTLSSLIAYAASSNQVITILKLNETAFDFNSQYLAFSSVYIVHFLGLLVEEGFNTVAKTA